MPREGQTTEPMWLESRKALSKWRVHTIITRQVDAGILNDI